MRRRSATAHASGFTRMRHKRSAAANQPRGQVHNGHVEQSSMEVFLQRLGSLRDAFIVVGGLIYACGFVAWGVVSIFNFGFGLSGANYAEYFVAGIVPFVGASFAYLALVKGPRLKKYVESEIDDHSRSWIGLGFVLTSVGIILVMSIFRDRMEEGLISFIAPLFFLLAIAMIPTAGLLLILGDFKEDPYRRWPKIEKILKYIHKFIKIAFLWISISFYIAFAFSLLLLSLILIERLPQGLGGIGPRCVVFDLVKEEISEKTAADLSDNGEASIKDQKIIRTNNLDLLFSGVNEYIIKHQDKTYEIAKNSVSIVAECD